MGRRNRNRNKNRNKNKQAQNNKQKLIEEEKINMDLIDIRRLKFSRCVQYYSDLAPIFLLGLIKIIAVIALLIFLIATIIFTIWAVYAYCMNSNEFALKILTVVQALSGIISVAVGVWALVLAIQANLRNNTVKGQLNIGISPSAANIKEINIENDVDFTSL